MFGEKLGNLWKPSVMNQFIMSYLIKITNVWAYQKTCVQGVPIKATQYLAKDVYREVDEIHYNISGKMWPLTIWIV